MIQRSFPVTLELNHKIFFTENVFDPQNQLLAEIIRDHTRSATKQQVVHVAVVVDTGVLKTNPQKMTKIRQYFALLNNAAENLTGTEFRALVISLQGGEAAKTLPEVLRLLGLLEAHDFDKQSILIGVGGGAVLDAVGLCASLFHRGMPLIRIPTTVLAQNDAGIGVKNGINAFGQKNFLGTFGVPMAVINDTEFLETLPDRFKRAGYAEAIKVAMLKDKQFFNWIVDNQERLAEFEPIAMAYLIKRTAILHCEHIACAGDPFEQGTTRPLDFGHWAAHKIECLSNYELAHGEAVIIGILIDTLYSVVEFGFARHVFEELFDLVKTLGFATWCKELDMTLGNNPKTKTLFALENPPALFEGMEEFRKHLGGKLAVPFLKDLGEVICAEHIDFGIMQTLLCELKLRAEFEEPPKFFTQPHAKNRERESLLC